MVHFKFIHHYVAPWICDYSSDNQPVIGEGKTLNLMSGYSHHMSKDFCVHVQNLFSLENENSTNPICTLQLSTSTVARLPDALTTEGFTGIPETQNPHFQCIGSLFGRTPLLCLPKFIKATYRRTLETFKKNNFLPPQTIIAPILFLNSTTYLRGRESVSNRPSANRLQGK